MPNVDERRSSDALTKARTPTRIFISSPGDLVRARTWADSVIAELNKTTAPPLGLVLESILWKGDATPAAGAPQSVINDQFREYDIYLGIMWSRFGTPTTSFGSGTEEEFRLAFDSWNKKRRPEIMFYFCEGKVSLGKTAEESDQHAKVVAFRQELSGKVLAKSFVNRRDFEQQLRTDLTKALTKHASQLEQRATPPSGAVPPAPTLIIAPNPLETLAVHRAPHSPRRPTTPPVGAVVGVANDAADTRPVRSFEELMESLCSLIESTMDGENLHILAYTPAIGFLSCRPLWRKLAVRLKQRASQVFVTCLNQDDLQRWHAEFTGRVSRRNGRIAEEQTLAATSKAEEFLQQLPRPTNRLKWDNMPGYYMFRNSRNAIVVSPCFVPVLHMGEEEKWRLKNSDAKLAVDMFGFITSDAHIVSNVIQVQSFYASLAGFEPRGDPRLAPGAMPGHPTPETPPPTAAPSVASTGDRHNSVGPDPRTPR